MKTIKDYFTKTYNPNDSYPMRNIVICKDGFTMSVQGSRTHYCSPRENTDYYFAYEIGFPSQEESTILEYAEDSSQPTNTVYGWVPFEKIDAIIENHGGFDLAAMNLI